MELCSFNSSYRHIFRCRKSGKMVFLSFAIHPKWRLTRQCSFRFGSRFWSVERERETVADFRHKVWGLRLPWKHARSALSEWIVRGSHRQERSQRHDKLWAAIHSRNTAACHGQDTATSHSWYSVVFALIHTQRTEERSVNLRANKASPMFSDSSLVADSMSFETQPLSFT